jgi:hypothetical protein
MNLIELSLAALLFAGATVSSLQLWGAAADASQSTEHRQDQLDQMERDRLQLMGAWRQQLLPGRDCASALAQLEAVATALPAPPAPLQRQLMRSADGQMVLVRWRVVDGTINGLERLRGFTPAGLGLCDGAPAPAPAAEVTP